MTGSIQQWRRAAWAETWVIVTAVAATVRVALLSAAARERRRQLCSWCPRCWHVLPENFPALSPGLWMCDGSAGNPSGDFVLFCYWLILLRDLPIRTSYDSVYNTYFSRLEEQPLILIENSLNFICIPVWRIRDPVPFWPLDPGSGMGTKIKILIRDEHPGSYFRKLRNMF